MPIFSPIIYSVIADSLRIVQIPYLRIFFVIGRDSMLEDLFVMKSSHLRILSPIVHIVGPECLRVLKVPHLRIALGREGIEIGEVAVCELSAMP